MYESGQAAAASFELARKKFGFPPLSALGTPREQRSVTGETFVPGSSKMGKIESITFSLGLAMSGLLVFASIAPVSTATAQAPSPAHFAAAPLGGQAL
jgi:hypothetical protein